VRQTLADTRIDPRGTTLALAELRRGLLAAPLPESLWNEIAQAYQSLGAGLVAVRSSALGEDLAGHSFAGLHDTILGVQGGARLQEAIKECWASLWSDRAFAYREKTGFAHEAAQMAVIIQALVAADASGVLFTADPVSGANDRLIIEGTFGLGDVLVSGKVTPDRIILARSNLAVLQRVIAEKRLESVIADGEVRERPVGPPRAHACCIGDATAIELGEMALHAENIFGQPQDIEWAVADDKIFILQSRPITTIPRKKSHAERQVWSNLNSGEVLPDVVSPMTWSFVERLIREIFSSILAKLGLSLDGRPLVGLIAGRAYFNLNTFAGIMRKIPGVRGMELETVFGGGRGNAGATGTLTLADEDIPDMNFNLLRVIFHLPTFLLWMMRHTTRGGLRCARKMRAYTGKIERLDLSVRSEAFLTELLQTLVERPALQADAIGYGGAGVMYFSQLFSLCRKWLGDADGSIANRLLSGMGSMDSAESGLALWRLAVLAQQDEEVSRTIRADQDFAGARDHLEASHNGRAFLQAWDGFMARHGHHCRGEIDFMNARWREMPDSVLDTVRSYLGNLGKTDPLALHERHGAEREQLAEHCRRTLRNPAKRWLFNLIVKQAQSGCLVRENVKSEAVRMLALGRRILLELGRKLAGRGLLDCPEDIFFLRLEEIDLVREKDANPSGRQLVSARRTEFEKNLQITPPPVVVGAFDPSRHAPIPFDAKARILTGLGVSAGVATGPARVITRSETHERVLPGEVLVAPFTDPGWTPYFLPASGIVVDQGGLLSHGSIIAREYGIPAVVNVGPATQIIRTGQMLQVDGNRGEVRILE
jgi:pyruvate,water dikinase